MKTNRLNVHAGLVAGALVLAALAACQKEGPMEQAGKKVDNVVEQAGQQIEKAGDSVQDATRRDKK